MKTVIILTFLFGLFLSLFAFDTPLQISLNVYQNGSANNIITADATNGNYTLTIKNPTQIPIETWTGSLCLQGPELVSTTGCSYTYSEDIVTLTPTTNNAEIPAGGSISIVLQLSDPFYDVGGNQVICSFIGTAAKAITLPENNEKILIIAGNPYDYTLSNLSKKGQEIEYTSKVYLDALNNGYKNGDIVYLFGIGQYSKAVSSLPSSLQSLVLPATPSSINYYMQSKNLQGIYFVADGLPTGIELENGEYFLYTDLKNINFHNNVIFVSNSCFAFNPPYGKAIIETSPKFFMAGISTLDDQTTYNLDLSKQVFESLLFKNMPISQISRLFTGTNLISYNGSFLYGIWGVYNHDKNLQPPTPKIESITAGSDGTQIIKWSISSSSINYPATDVAVRYTSGNSYWQDFDSSVLAESQYSPIANTYYGSVVLNDNWLIQPIPKGKLSGTITINNSNDNPIGSVMVYQLFLLNSITASDPVSVTATRSENNQITITPLQ